jgi:hypothetical protein
MIERLVKSVRTLAAPTPTDLKDREIANDFADALLLASDCPQVQLTPVQASALRALSDLIDGMSGADHAALWTETASLESPQWVEVRHAAARALSTLEHN